MTLRTLAGWLAALAVFTLGGCANPGLVAPMVEAAPAPAPAVEPAPAAAPVVVIAPSEPAPPTAAALAALAAANEAAESARRAEMILANEPAIAVDPLRPDVPVVLDDPVVRTDLWARVRKGYGVPSVEGALVRKWEQYYASKPDYVARMTDRGGRYLFHVVEEIEKRGMPVDLALLPFIESAFNPQAHSVASASGMWQFIPSTGKDFKLRQNVFRDDRRDVLASTRAALEFLQSLHRRLGDWQLALAAYNWGPGSVHRAQERNRAAGKPVNYESLQMPDETRNYLPKLQAIKNIVKRPETFGLTLPALENHPYFLSVRIARDIDVTVAARLAGLPLEEFHALNPQMNKPVILASGTPQVLLPYDNAAAFIRNLPKHQGPLASWTAWTVPKTLRAADAARQVGMSEDTLREVNRIPPRMLVKAGSTLLVSRSPQRDIDVSPQVADHAMLALAPDLPPLRKVTFRAGKKGDTVAAVASRYKVSAAQVAQWNGVAASARFAPGKSVVVMVSQAGTRQVAGRAGKRQVAGRAGKGVVRKAAASNGGRAAVRVAATRPRRG